MIAAGAIGITQNRREPEACENVGPVEGSDPVSSRITVLAGMAIQFDRCPSAGVYRRNRVQPHQVADTLPVKCRVSVPPVKNSSPRCDSRGFVTDL